MDENALENRSTTELAQAIIQLVQESKRMPFDLIWKNDQSHIDGDPSFIRLMMSFLRRHHFEYRIPQNTFDEDLLISLSRAHGLLGNRALLEYDQQPQAMRNMLNGVLTSVFIRIQEHLNSGRVKKPLTLRTSKINQARGYFNELASSGDAYVGMLQFVGTNDNLRRTKVNWSRIIKTSFASMPPTARGCWVLYSGSPGCYRFTVVVAFELIENPYCFGPLVAQHFLAVLENNGYGFCPVNNGQASAGFDKWGTLVLNQADLIAETNRIIRCNIPGTEPNIVMLPASCRPPSMALLSALTAPSPL